VSPRAAALAELLRGRLGKRVSLDELWGLFDRVAPELQGSAQRRALLSEAVAELVDAGVLAPWRSDDGGRPPLPRSVRWVEAAAAPARTRRAVMWHPELSWADGLRLSEAQVVMLEKVNRWLFANGSTSRPAPLRERAYEICGDEKAFDGGPLFGGSLTMEVLRAYRPRLPLPAVRIGPGPDLLVAENGDTFDSLRRTLAARPGSIGRVAWGAGAGFESSVLSLAEADDLPAAIHYFGDVDTVGLRIPASASALALEAGLPAVRPAVRLYTELFMVGHPQDRQTPMPRERARKFAAWLAPQHQEVAASLLESGHRLAQEAVGIGALAVLDGWPPD
jgi:hypothetical protein